MLCFSPKREEKKKNFRPSPSQRNQKIKPILPDDAGECYLQYFQCKEIYSYSLTIFIIRFHLLRLYC